MSDLTQEKPATQSEIFDLLVVGAGPTGLACAIEAQKAGLSPVMVDKGCVCNSLFHYPAHMTFFTTPELLEIGGIPFPSPHAKPNRNEALQYYRRGADHYKLDIRQYHRVERVEGSDGAFTVHTMDRFGRAGAIHARKLVIATGYYDLPNYLHIPGENLSKVHHYYFDQHIGAEVGGRVEVVMMDLAEVFAGNVEVVGQVVVAGGDDQLAGMNRASAAKAVHCVHGESAVTALDPLHAMILADVQFIVVRPTPVILERLVAVGLGVGAGKGDAADFQQFGRGEEGHVRGVVKERVADASLVHHHGAQTGLLCLDGAGQTRGSGAHY